jgi:hypothetical protein
MTGQLGPVNSEQITRNTFFVLTIKIANNMYSYTEDKVFLNFHGKIFVSLNNLEATITVGG